MKKRAKKIQPRTLTLTRQQLILASSSFGLIFGFSLFHNGTCSSDPTAVTAPTNSTVTTTLATPAPSTQTYTNFYVNSYSPASGTGSMPNSVQVYFSMNLGNNASTLANWTWSCSSGTVASNTPTSVTISGSTATVSLPSVTGQSIGSTCTLTPSATITDTAGDLLSNSQGVVYTLGQTVGTTQAYVGYFSNPTANKILMGKVNLTISVFNASNTYSPPKTIQFLINNVVIYSNNYTGLQFTNTFDTTVFPNGNYTLHVNAFDQNNVQYSDIATPVPVTIANMDPDTSSLCSTNNGTGVLANGTAICKISSSQCPSQMMSYGDGNWTTTSSVHCDGGSTWGCGSTHSGDSGYHSTFADTAPEQIYEPTLAACGPATTGGKTCTATITSMGCVVSQ